MTQSLSTEERAQAIRRALKKAGYNRRHVSVRKQYFSMGSAIDVTVRDADVSLRKIKEIAQGFERIDRCEVSGEILSGCNCYLKVGYSDDAYKVLIDRAMPSVNVALERLQGHGESDTSYEPCLDGLVGFDGANRDRYHVRNAQDQCRFAFNAEGVAAFLIGTD